MIYTVVEILATVMDTVFLVWFIPNFLNTKFYRKSNLKFLALPILLLALELSADWLLPGFDLIVVFSHIGIALIYSLLLCNKKIFRAIIAATSYMLAIMFVGSIVYMIISQIVGDKTQAFQGADSVARIIYLVICKLTEYFIYKILLHFFHKSNATDRKNIIFFSAFILMSILGLSALMIVALYDFDSKLTMPIMIIMAVLTVSIFIVIIFVHKLLEAQKREYEYRLIAERSSFMQKSINEAGNLWENMRRVRHDLKNSLAVVSAKLNSQEYDDCLEYINKLTDTVQNFGDVIKTDNALVDYLINSKLSDAKNGITATVLGYIDDYSDIDEVDLASILGNVIDNAVEAEMKIPPEERAIELHFLSENRNRIIVCKNKIAASVLKTNKQLKSSKKDSQLHGLGHKIVEETVEKYNGFVNYNEDEDMFSVQIILPQK